MIYHIKYLIFPIIAIPAALYTDLMSGYLKKHFYFSVYPNYYFTECKVNVLIPITKVKIAIHNRYFLLNNYLDNNMWVTENSLSVFDNVYYDRKRRK